MCPTALFRLAALSLILGGVLALGGHIIQPLEPTDPSALLNYTQRSQPSHLLIFFGAVFVMLGLQGVLFRQRTRAGLPGLIAVYALFFGLLLGEVIHSVLEFSILPLLVRSFPYAAIPLVQACYQGTPLAILQKIGEFLCLAGVPLLGIVMLRARVFPGWAALPLCLSTPVGFATLISSLNRVAMPLYPLCFYASSATLGFALWSSLRLSVSFREVSGEAGSAGRAYSSVN